jgi:hypothetical protein
MVQKYESHEDYMKRRTKEDEDAYEDSKWEEYKQLLDKKYIFESPDNGKTIYKRPFGSNYSQRVKIISSDINYKFDEDKYIQEIKEYIDSTYSQHYSTNKFQSTEVIIDRGHGTGFCMGNVDKYSNRYGKKGTKDDARKDLLKVIHYALLQLYVHDNEQ